MSFNYDMTKAPRDGTLLQLLIQQPDDHNCGFDDDDVTRTMGFNNFTNDGEDEWKFPGWSWTHDYIKEQGHGTPIAWALMLELPDAAEREAAGYTFAGETPKGECARSSAMGPEKFSLTIKQLGIRRIILTPTQFAVQFAEDSAIKPSQVWDAFQALVQARASKEGK